MTQLTARTNIVDTYPNPTNAQAKAGLGAMYDVINEVTQKAEVDVPSASTIDIGSLTTNKIRITGTTTITSFGTTYRGPIYIRFTGALTLTNNSTTLRLPGNANITTVAGDRLVLSPVASTSGVFDGWEVINYVRAAALPAASGANSDITSLSQVALSSSIATSATGTDTLTATFTPAVTSLVNGLSILLRAAAANTSTTPTLSVNGLTAKTIVKGNNLALVAGDIAGAGHWIELQFDTTLDKWVLQNPANGVVGIQLASSATTQAGVNTTQAVTPAGLAATMLGGVGQTWQVVTGSRSQGVTYTNSTGRPIIVLIGASASGGSPQVEVLIGGTQMINWTFPYGTANPLTFTVPNGATYRVNMLLGYATVASWAELR